MDRYTVDPATEAEVDFDPFTPAPALENQPEPSAPPAKAVAPKSSEVATPSTAPAGSEAARPAPAPASAAPPKTQQGTLPEPEIDFEITPPAPKDRLGSQTAFTRGLIGSTIDTTKSFGDAYEAFRVLKDPEAPVDFSPRTPHGYERQVPSVGDIDWDFDKFLTWMGESAGAAPAQLLPTLGAGALGTSAGALTSPVTGPVGPVAGGLLAATSMSAIQNYADVWQGFKEDPGIRKALADGKITLQQLSNYALATGLVVSTVDVASLGKITKRLPGAGAAVEGVENQIKRFAIQAIAKDIAEGAITEGTAEAIQSVIAQGAEIQLGDYTNVDAANRVIRVIDEFFGGAFGGGPTQAVSGVVERGKTVKQPEVPGQADPQQPEGVPTPPAPASPPGDTTAKTPAAPAGAPASATTPAPLSTTPAQPPVVKPATAAPPAAPAAIVTDGGVAPEVAAALPSTGAVPGGQPVGAPAPVPEPPVSALPIDEDVIDETAPVDEDAELLLELQGLETRRAAAAQRIAAQNQAQTAQVVPPGTDEQAALAAGVPAAQPQEPPGTPEAQARREAPQPIPTPAAAEPAAGVVAQGLEPVSSPQLAPAPLNEAEVDFDPTVPPAPAEAPLITSPIVSPPLEPAVIPPAEPVEALPALGAPDVAPLAPLAPAATPGAPAPLAAPIDRETEALRNQVMSALRQELHPTVATAPEMQQVAEEVAREIRSREPTMKARGFVERFAKRAAIETRRRIVRGRRKAERQVKRAGEARHPVAVAEHKRLKAERAAPQEKKRAGKTGKASEAVATQGKKAWETAGKKEMEKPEAERSPALVAHHEAAEAHKKYPKKEDRAYYKKKMEAAKAEYVAELEAKEAAAAPAKPPADEVRAERQAKVNPELEAAFAASPDINPDTIRSDKAAGLNLAETITRDVNANREDFLKDVRARLKSVGASLPANPHRINNSPEENLAVFAARNPQPIDWLQAKLWLRMGDLRSFHDFIRAEGKEKQNVSLSRIEGRLGQAAPGGDITVETAAKPARRYHMPAAGDTINIKTKRRINGKTVTNEADATVIREISGRQALQEISQAPVAGLFGVLRRQYLRSLNKMVGDIPITFISGDDMRRVSPDFDSAGFYQAGKPGEKGVIIVNQAAYDARSETGKAHLIVHELSHAATDFSLNHNWYGTHDIMESMRSELEKFFKQTGIWNQLDGEMQYGFLNAHEFVAEAFSNPRFQQILQQVTVPRQLHGHLRALSRGRTVTWWDTFVAAVANALNIKTLYGRGSTYLDHMIAAQPAMMHSTQELITGVARRGTAIDIDDAHPLSHHLPRLQLGEKMAALRIKDGFGPWSRFKRWMGSTWVSTGQIMRDAKAAYGKNPVTDAGRLLQLAAGVRTGYQQIGDKLVVELNRLMHTPKRTEVLALANIFNDSQLGEFDPTVPISHENNRHIKNGLLQKWQRFEHSQQHAAWNKLSPEVKAIGQKIVDHYRKQQDLHIHLQIRNIIQAAIDAHSLTLPAGETLEKVARWVFRGDIDRIVSDLTARDVALLRALGKTADSLRQSKQLRKVRGMYVPFTREGQYILSARHPVKPADGGVLDPSAVNGDELVFHDQKKLTAYQQDPKREDQILNIKPEFRDASGAKVHHKDVNAIKSWRVTLQNHIVEMSDSQNELAKRRDHFKRQGFKAKQVMALDEINRNSEILPIEFRRLVVRWNRRAATRRSPRWRSAP